MIPTPPDMIQAAYATFPNKQRMIALQLRDLVFSVADDHPEIGPVTETLKWGQPSFTTPTTKAGTTVRIGITKAGDVGLFVHCTTTIIRDYVATFPDQDRVDGNRGIVFSTDAEIVPERLRLLIHNALTYHL